MFQTVIGDIAIGVCVCKPKGPSVGIVTTGNPQELIQGMPAARTGDVVIWPCGASVIIGSTSSDFSSGPNEGVTGDNVVGCGVGNLANGSHEKLVGG